MPADFYIEIMTVLCHHLDVDDETVPFEIITANEDDIIL